MVFLSLAAPMSAGAESTPIDTPGLGTIVLNLLLVLAVIAALAWIVRRTPLAGKSDGPLAVKSTLTLSQRERLVLVRYADRELLLGVNGQRITLLSDAPCGTDSPEDEPVQNAVIKPFAALLERQR